MGNFEPVKLDDFEYGEVRFLDTKGHDSERLTVDMNLGDHGVTLIAEDLDDSTGDYYRGIVLWPQDLPTVIKALIAAHDHVSVVPYDAKKVEAK